MNRDLDGFNSDLVDTTGKSDSVLVVDKSRATMLRECLDRDPLVRPAGASILLTNCLTASMVFSLVLNFAYNVLKISMINFSFRYGFD